jgi:hypothetical protein
MCTFIHKSIVALAIAATLSAATASSQGTGAKTAVAKDSYYMILFAFDSTPRAPQLAHVFAVFVKAQGDGMSAQINEAYPISWSTARPNLRLLIVKRPDPGVNLDLPATFRLSAALNTQVTAFGPYQIRKELFDRAAAQYRRLNAGELAYKMLDGGTRLNGAVNCIHAVSDIAPGPLLNTGTAYGMDAAAMVRSHMAPWIVDNGPSHAWLVDRLGLRQEPIAFVNEQPETAPAPGRATQER